MLYGTKFCEEERIYKVLYGTQVERDEWNMCIDYVNYVFGLFRDEFTQVIEHMFSTNLHDDNSLEGVDYFPNYYFDEDDYTYNIGFNVDFIEYLKAHNVEESTLFNLVCVMFLM